MAVTTRTNALSTRDLDDMGVEIQNCQDTNDDNARFMSVMRERSIVLGSASPIEATLIPIMSTIGSCKKGIHIEVLVFIIADFNRLGCTLMHSLFSCRFFSFTIRPQICHLLRSVPDLSHGVT